MVSVFLMITGIVTFAMVTSRLGAAFLHSKSKEILESKAPLSLDSETRSLLEQQIDHVGSLSEREVDTLTAIIKALWRAKNKKDP
jgi:hypothetical protein